MKVQCSVCKCDMFQHLSNFKSNTNVVVNVYQNLNQLQMVLQKEKELKHIKVMQY